MSEMTRAQKIHAFNESSDPFYLVDHGDEISLTNLLLRFREPADLDIGRLVAWRLATYDQFGGTWLSDYIG